MTSRVPGWRWPPRSDRPLVLGHRGVGRVAPGDADPARPVENTLAAFERAADDGADGVELDVRVCASGELVVFHDPDLARATGGADTRHVAAVPLTELTRIDLGGGARVPTLFEVLELARARRLRVNVEMKRDAPSRRAIVLATAGVLHATDPRWPVLVSSFDPVMLGGIAALVPGVPRGLLVSPDGWYPRTAALASPLGCAAVHPSRTLTRPAAIARWRRQGLLVHVWTVNDPREARDLAALEVDAIITDVPAAVRDAIEPARGAGRAGHPAQVT